ncbi:hypothetical protein BC941DRAFT_517593 [Chlamydoabsidia padenii]|nr:hypothetical protein BC941DRAFT_517593 [Chlamydoabsidia padenii]
MEQAMAQQCVGNAAQYFNNAHGGLLDVCMETTMGDDLTSINANSLIFTRLVGFVPSLLFRVIGFITITIPLFFYRILTWSLTVHLNFSSLAMVLVLVCLVGYYVIRYRYLTTYSRLQPINSQKPTSSFDLHPDSGEDAGYSKPSIRNYPDEFLSVFLSSIKIFGYLEQPVFHELARHLQTKKLLAGDTLFQNPEQERSFYIVVDGHVQMFVKPDNSDVNDYDGSSFGDTDESTTATTNSSSDDDVSMDPWTDKKQYNDEFKHYTLINEVTQGGTLSSLFTILSIFRESFNRAEIKIKNKSMRHQAASRSSSTQHRDSADMRRDPSSDEWRHVFPNLDYQGSDGSLPISTSSSVVATPDMSPKDDQRRRHHHHRMDSFDSTGNSNHGSRKPNKHLYTTPVKDPQVQVGDYEHVDSGTDIDTNNIIDVPLDDDFINPRLRKMTSHTSSYYRRQYRSVHPNIIARATVDTTLAVITEEAFHKLTQKFPKAASHIVQVIVTRFQRVTLMTSHRYLGLTTELLRLEKKLTKDSVSNQGVFWNLPAGDFYLSGAVDRLRKKFSAENGQDNKATSKTDESKDANNKHASTMVDIEQSNSPGIIQAINIMNTLASSPVNETLKHVSTDSRPPGDLIGSTSSDLQQRHKRQQQHYNSKVSGDDDYSMEDDEHLRIAVMKCLSDSLGIEMAPEINPSDNNKLPPLSYSKDSCAHSRSKTYFDSHDARQHSRTVYPIDLFGITAVSPTLDALESHQQDEWDNVSTISSAYSGTDSRHKHISPEDISILYYPKGDTLVREKEHFTGLFFVIDGLLEATMTPTEGEEGSTNPILQGNNNKIRPVKQSSSIMGFCSKMETQSSNKSQQVVASEAPAGRQPISTQKKSKKKQTKKLAFHIHPGGLAGYLGALTGHPSFVDIRAKQNTFVGYLSKKSLDRLIDRNPTVMIKLAKQLVDSLSPLLLHIDLSLEWVQVNAGQIICREGQPSESIHMVLHGRLRTIKEKKEGHLEILGEFGHGESVGELEVLTGAPNTFTLHAIRDSELARIPKTLFNALAHRHPEVTLQISRMVAYRSLQLVMNKSVQGQDKNASLNLQYAISANPSSFQPAINVHTELYGRNNVNLKTIGILPVNSMIPLTEFASNLKSALMHDVSASCILLNSATITTVMGKHAFSKMGKLKIASWLAEQEEKARIVLYLADSGVNSKWTRTCIRQADCILLVGLGDEDPSVGEYERYMINMKTTARKELVLLHRERFCIPGSTQNWLKNRLWIQAHHHIFMPMKKHGSYASNRTRPQWLSTQGRKMTESSISMLNNVKDQLEKYYSVVPTFGSLMEMNKKGGNALTSVDSLSRNDFARLARRLCGRSVAVVLGGGGARGLGHVGVLQALEETGVPIDIIGGTSIGSFIAGLYGQHMDLVSTIARAKLFANRLASMWRMILDLTYPVTAWCTGHEFNRAVWKCIGDSLVEDFWLPFFAVTTNITFSRMEVHTTGYAWRYIRASMSLSGYLPPVCENGDLLVDGGYMDNLPVTVAKKMGADIVIAVDVASDDDTNPVYYGDTISGWWALLHRWNPFRTYNIPSIAEIQSRLACVSSVAKLEQAKLTDGTLYVKLPVQQWGTVEFNRFDDIKSLGYSVGKTVVGKWLKAGYATGRLTEGEDHQGRWLGKEVKALIKA